MDNLCASWVANIAEDSQVMILPDGCRDLIMESNIHGAPQNFISPLFDQSRVIQLKSDSFFSGFRLKPGVNINEIGLLKAIHNKSVDQVDVLDLLSCFTRIDTRTEEALNCLASDVLSVQQASARLGVSVRTLQRWVLKETKQSPGFWFQLARARKAAYELSKNLPFIEVSNKHGFSDQPHMNREFRRWFNMSPSQILKSEPILAQLQEAGYH